jgi:hypothetical protein
MKNIIYLWSALLFVTASTLSISSCSNNNTVVPTEEGNFAIEFDNYIGSKNLVLNGTTYKNAAGEDFTVTMLNYYISNFKLLKADGSSYTVPQDSSYFLIKEADKASQTVKLKNIPAGQYTGVEFMIGVDSLRNTLGLDKWYGVLDQGSHDAEGMYWAWNSGFIFLKMEGISPAAPANVNGKYRYHIGLYGGDKTPTLNNIRTTKVLFGGKSATVGINATPQVHLIVDALKIFDGTTKVSIAANPTIMTADYSKNIANNYMGMFSFDHIHNNE